VKQGVETLQDEHRVSLERIGGEGSIATQHGDPLAEGVRGGQYHFNFALKHQECVLVLGSCEIDKVFGIDLDEPIITKVLGQDVEAMTDSVDKHFRFQWYYF
jgi:hypothetical protein